MSKENASKILEFCVREPLRRATDGKTKPHIEVANAVSSTPSAARAWFYGEAKPSGEALMRLMAAYPEIFEAVLAEVGAHAQWRPGDVAHAWAALSRARRA